jgi:hypothetical protein
MVLLTNFSERRRDSAGFREARGQRRRGVRKELSCLRMRAGLNTNQRSTRKYLSRDLVEPGAGCFARKLRPVSDGEGGVG